jgi:SAM-dependent methyltransferase
VELGCGLGVPSIAAARAGATVLATDGSPEALTLLRRNAQANGARIETAAIDWTQPDDLLSGPMFDMVLAADVLYERASVTPLLSLLPRLAREALLADPGRPAADAFIEEAMRRAWQVETRSRGIVQIHWLRPVPKGDDWRPYAPGSSARSAFTMKSAYHSAHSSSRSPPSSSAFYLPCATSASRKRRASSSFVRSAPVSAPSGPRPKWSPANLGR